MPKPSRTPAGGKAGDGYRADHMRNERAEVAARAAYLANI